jgi:ABC-2 type transport system ATP-binding protein
MRDAVPSSAVPSQAPAIEVSGLVVRYGDLTAVGGIDLQASAGEVVAVLGRNGAGKTSTVETLEGYRRRAAGSVRVLGLDPGEQADARSLTSRIGIMLQRGGVYPSMGPAEALRLFSSYYESPEDPADLVERMRLSHVARTPWRRLSGGEQQRLSLALALVGRPEVAFLDEPTAGVDPQGRIAIRAEIARLRDRAACVLLTTHELEEAERVADRIVIIDRGRIVASGTLGELTGGTAVIRFSAPAGIDAAGLGTFLGAAVVEETPGRYLASIAGTPAVIARLASWLAERDLPLSDLRAGMERLEDLFLRVTADGDGGMAGDGGTETGNRD